MFLFLDTSRKKQNYTFHTDVNSNIRNLFSTSMLTLWLCLLFLTSFTYNFHVATTCPYLNSNEQNAIVKS